MTMEGVLHGHQILSSAPFISLSSGKTPFTHSHLVSVSLACQVRRREQVGLWGSKVGHKRLEHGIALMESLKACAGRRRSYLYADSDTYVLLEPGQAEEEFVSEDELKDKLKGWLENWPGKTLPPDLAAFSTIDEAVNHLVKSVCELEIDGDVGSIQWYRVRLD